MTFLFNTSFHIHNSAITDFKQWAIGTYIPSAYKSEWFSQPVMLEVLTSSEPEESVTYCIQMFSDDPEKAMEWFESESPKLLSELTGKHGQEKILHFTSVMRVVNEQ